MESRSYTYNNSSLVIVFGDILSSQAEVIVSTDDSAISMEGSISGAIRKAGGEEIRTDAQRNTPARMGDVVVSTAGTLNYKYIFHTITTDSERHLGKFANKITEVEDLTEYIISHAIEKSFRLTNTLDVNSIALPVIGTGATNLPFRKAAQIMAKSIASCLANSSKSYKVELFVFDKYGKFTEEDYIYLLDCFSTQNAIEPGPLFGTTDSANIIAWQTPIKVVSNASATCVSLANVIGVSTDNEGSEDYVVADDDYDADCACLVDFNKNEIFLADITEDPVRNRTSMIHIEKGHRNSLKQKGKISFFPHNVSGSKIDPRKSIVQHSQESKIHGVMCSEKPQSSKKSSSWLGFLKKFKRKGTEASHETPDSAKEENMKTTHTTRNNEQDVNASIFAPLETRRGDYMMVQVFLYMDDEEWMVARKAREIDSEAERRNFTPLSVRLKFGDKVKATMQLLNKDAHVEEPSQVLIWRGRFTGCQFAVSVSNGYSSSTLLSKVVLSVNGVPVGSMMFKTSIVDTPSKLYAEIACKAFHKIFISYSHKDEGRVKYIAEAYKAQGVDYFFDRHYLKAGDIYPLQIQQYIDTADLFILCWSKNAEESEYVALERKRALSHAYPQVSMENASITIHPISIEPHAAYPEDMDCVYNFEEV